MGNEHRVLHFALVALAALLSGCSEQTNPTVQESASPIEPKSDPFIKVEAKALNDSQVRFIVETNIPTPVEVMAGLSLAGMAPDDVFVGSSNRVTLTGPKTELTLDAKDADGTVLPSGDYDAEVGFYQRWSADNGNPDAAAYPNTQGSVAIKWVGSGVPAEEVSARKEMQRWVMGNINMDSPWNKASYESRLGRSVIGPSTLSHLHDAYYFPDADVTLIVNRLKNEVTIWRLGDKTQ